VATDAEHGVISPGAIGFDINCGVRLLATSLALDAVTGRLGRLIDALYEAIPTGVGSKGRVTLAARDADAEVRVHATASLGRLLLEWRSSNLRLSPSLAERVRTFLLERAAAYQPIRERRYAIEALGWSGDHPDVAAELDRLFRR
jgi:hypothetical protein